MMRLHGPECTALPAACSLTWCSYTWLRESSRLSSPCPWHSEEGGRGPPYVAAPAVLWFYMPSSMGLFPFLHLAFLFPTRLFPSQRVCVALSVDICEVEAEIHLGR